MKHARGSQRPEEPVSHDPHLAKRVLLRAGEVAGILQLAHCRLPAGRGVTPHAHERMTEVFVVVRGRGWAIVGRRRLRLERMDCVVIEPGERHRVQAAPDSALELVYFGLPRGRSVRRSSEANSVAARRTRRAI